MAFKDTVLFSSLVALAVLSFNVLVTRASFNSQNLSNQWGDVKSALTDIRSSTVDTGLASQNLKDAIEDYQSGRTDYTPVLHAQHILGQAKYKFCMGLNEYFTQSQEFEYNGLYNFANNPFTPFHQHNVYPTSPLTHPYFPSSTTPSDPQEDLTAP